jgi:hypothetical protein
MQLILIGGAQRSGTTLLQTLLANALDSPLLPEAHILSDILASFKRAKDFGQKTRFFYADDSDLQAFFQSYVDRHIADVVAAAKPGEALVLKDPNLALVLDEASILLPEALRIVCLRDPRDIAASFVQIGQRQKGDKPSKYEKRDIGFISQKILGSYRALLEPSQPGAVIVRYEELASDPKGTLEAIARETALEFSFDRIERPVWIDAQARHDASWISELEGGRASPASIGSFQRVLRGDEIAVVQNICRPIMSRFGYAPVEDWALRRDRVLKRVGLRRTRSWSA